MTRILFLFTKKYPFGDMEQYLHEEVPVLSRHFEEVVVVPSELFGSLPVQRELPPNFRIFDVNQVASGVKRRQGFLSVTGIMLNEFRKEKKKLRLIREFGRYKAILLHQLLLSEVMKGELMKYEGKRVTFYSYWLHNSVVMLGLLKRKGVLQQFASRAHSIDLFHNDWPFADQAGTKVLPFQYFKMKETTAIYPISEDGAIYMRKKFPAFAAKVKVSYLGVRDRGEGPYHQENIFTIVSCSRVIPIKQVDVIAGIIDKMKTPVRWLHFGDGSMMEDLRNNVAVIKGEKRIELRGATANAEIMHFYANEQVNLFINMSRIEGLPVSIMEAISFGIPVMGPAIAGIPEIVNSSTGFLVKPSAGPEECAAVIDKFALDKEAQRKLRASTRRFYLESFNNENNFTGFCKELERYEQVLNFK